MFGLENFRKTAHTVQTQINVFQFRHPSRLLHNKDDAPDFDISSIIYMNATWSAFVEGHKTYSMKHPY